MEEKSFLLLEVVWKDDEMLELQITASNQNYKGVTQVYADAESLLDVASQLVDFPNGAKTIFYTCGETNGYAYFSARFYLANANGYIGVQIELEENISGKFTQGERSKLFLEIIAEQAAIDEFQRFLATLAKNRNGKAILMGIPSWHA